MRTRRSHRNQEILWRALAGPAPVKHATDTVEAIERMLATPFLSKTSRSMLERDLAKARTRESRVDDLR